jgi:hypothetical protein
MSIKNISPANSYKRLLNVENTNGVDGTIRVIIDGEGNNSSMGCSVNDFRVQPDQADSTGVFSVNDKDGNRLLYADSVNDTVKALSDHVNTQYATFSVGYTQATSFADDTHTALPFGGSSYGNKSYPPQFGTGTDPATTFTTSEGNNTRASDIVACMWYLQDNISIDAVSSIEGADTATGDTTRMHLYSYTFTSGATNCLTSGTLLAHNNDVSNDGSEQPYLSTWSIDSASVAAGKVILAFFKSDSINSDYTIQINVKYHLT